MWKCIFYEIGIYDCRKAKRKYIFFLFGYRLATEPSPAPEQKCLNAKGIKVTRVGGNMFLPLGNPGVEQHKKI
jgi:hypothetical protein